MSYTYFGIHKIRVGQIHRRPTRPQIRVGLVLHVLHGSGAYDEVYRITRCGDMAIRVSWGIWNPHFGKKGRS